MIGGKTIALSAANTSNGNSGDDDGDDIDSNNDSRDDRDNDDDDDDDVDDKDKNKGVITPFLDPKQTSCNLYLTLHEAHQDCRSCLFPYFPN